MSLDAAVASLVEALSANTDALKRVADNQDRLIAGQAAAIEKIEAPKATRGRPKKDAEPQEGNAEPVATASRERAATTASEQGGVTDDNLKATAVAWMGTTDDADEKKRRAMWLHEAIASITGEEPGHLMLTGEQSKLGAEGRKKMVFFIKRAHKMKSTEHVSFTAPYDFDGPADQDTPCVEQASEDFDPLG